MNENTPLWKVTFSANLKSTIKHYDLHVLADDANKAIELAKKWYIDHLQKGEEPDEPFIHSVKIIASFVVFTYYPTHMWDEGLNFGEE